MSDSTKKVQKGRAELKDRSLDVGQLDRCTKYIFAIALVVKGITNQLYIEQTIETGGWHEPSKNSFKVVVHEDSLSWQEVSGPCAKRYASTVIARRVLLSVFVFFFFFNYGKVLTFYNRPIMGMIV